MDSKDRARLRRRGEPYETDLYGAAEAGDIPAVRTLLDAGADIERGKSARASNKSPLSVACQKGHLEVATLLLDRGAALEATSDTNLVRGRRIWTPLLFAAYGCHVPLVRMLVARGADVHFEDDEGCGPIRVALIAAHFEDSLHDRARAVVALLQEQGARVDPKAAAFLTEMDSPTRKRRTRIRKRTKS